MIYARKNSSTFYAESCTVRWHVHGGNDPAYSCAASLGGYGHHRADNQIEALAHARKVLDA